MREGETFYRTAAALRPYLLGRPEPGGVWSGRQALPPLRLSRSRSQAWLGEQTTFWCPRCQPASQEAQG